MDNVFNRYRFEIRINYYYLDKENKYVSIDRNTIDFALRILKFLTNYSCGKIERIYIEPGTDNKIKHLKCDYIANYHSLRLLFIVLNDINDYYMFNKLDCHVTSVTENYTDKFEVTKENIDNITNKFIDQLSALYGKDLVDSLYQIQNIRDE